MSLWSADKFQYVKSVHVISCKVLGQSILIETVDSLIDVSNLVLVDNQLSARITVYSRFLERIALAAVDPGGRRPTERS